MYFGPPPATIETQVFSALPDALRTGKGLHANALEGPSFDREGNFFCVDMAAGRVYRVSVEGEWDIVVEYDGIPNGLKFHRDGRIFIADRKRGIVALDPSSGKLDFLCAGPSEGVRFIGLNDLIFGKEGDLYVTDQGRSGLQDPSGKVYRYHEGRIELVVGNLPSPNGLVFNARETELFVALTRANSVWRTELTDPARRTGLFVQLASPGPDGLALDEDGNVYIAQPTAGAVWGFSKRGVPLYYVPACCGDMPTNIAFGGPDNCDLYITETRTCTILRARLPVAGKLMFGQR
jgi:gluconolactonase